MANEILTSSMGDQLAAEVISKKIELALADRETIRNDPAVVYVGDIGGLGSTVHSTVFLGLDGYDAMAATSENSSTSNTALADSVAQITIARKALQYEMSDLARIVDATGAINFGRFAQSMVKSADMALQTSIADVTDGFSNYSGTSGADMTIDDLRDAITLLELSSVPGPYLCMLHPRQYADLRISLEAVAGAYSWMPATQAQLALRGPGYKGSFLDIPFFVSSKVPTANGGNDRAGGLFGRGAVLFGDAAVPADERVPAIYAGPVMIEMERSAAGALSKIVGNYYYGVVIGEDLRGASIITDA